MKPLIQKPIYYTDGSVFYRKYKGIRAARDGDGKWVELPCYVKPTLWEVPPCDVDDPEFPDDPELPDGE